MNDDPVELIDLGNATEGNKAVSAIPAFPDSIYYWGLVPDLG